MRNTWKGMLLGALAGAAVGLALESIDRAARGANHAVHATPDVAARAGGRARHRAVTLAQDGAGYRRARRSAGGGPGRRAGRRPQRGACGALTFRGTRRRAYDGSRIPQRRRAIMGLTDKAKGKAKEFEGKATGDKQREAEGKVEQAKGEVKDAVQHVRDAAGNLVERVADEAAAQRAERERREDRR